MAIERVMTSVFYAMDKNKYAYTLIYGKWYLMGILATVVFYRLYGGNERMALSCGSANRYGGAVCAAAEKVQGIGGRSHWCTGQLSYHLFIFCN